MSVIVTVADDQDPYGRHAKAVQREDGSWAVEYFAPGGLDDAVYEHGDLIGYQTVPVDGWIPTEADVAEFMCDVLADREKFGGRYPEAGFRRFGDQA